jgi:hypothetical protein
MESNGDANWTFTRIAGLSWNWSRFSAAASSEIVAFLTRATLVASLKLR